MILAVVFLTVLTQAAAVVNAPDTDLGYGGLSLKTTQAQLLARFPNAWRPADGGRVGADGEYSIANDVKNRRDVDYVEARVKRGKIEALSFIVNRNCRRVVAELIAAFGPPNEINRYEDYGQVNETRIWRSSGARLTVMCPVN